MRQNRLWLFGLWLLVWSPEAIPADEPTTKQPKGTTIFPDDIPLRPGGGLSVRTSVSRPRSVKGARSWTVETRRHRWAAIDLAVSPDGTLVATSGYDGMIRLWNAATGRLVRVVVGHDSYVFGIAWSADGRYLASTGSYDSTVRVWEAGTGLPVKVFKGLKNAPLVVAWSPDGSLLAAGTIESGDISIWSVASGVPEKTISSGKAVLSLAFSPDGKTLACGVSQVGVVFRSAPSLAVESQIEMTGQDPRGLSFSADGKELVVGGGKSSMVWDIAGKKIARKFDWPAVALARHGNRAAVTSPAGKMVDLDTGKSGVALPLGSAVSWSADGKAIYVLSGNDVLHVDPAKGTEVKRWSVADTETIWWTPGRAMVTGIGTTKPRLWDTATGKLLHTLEGHTAATTTLAWSVGGKFLATGGHDKTVRVWSPATGKLLHTLGGFEGAVTSLAVAADGKIAAGSADQKVRVFAAGETKLLKTFTGHTDAVRALAWSRDGRLASGGLDASVRLWGLDGNKSLPVLSHAGSVESLAFAPNGKWLAAGASEDRVTVWTYPGRKNVHEFSAPGSPPNVTALAWATDSNQLLAGRANHTIQLWDLKLGKERHNIGVLAPVQSVKWTTGNRTMVSCTIDRCVRFWSATKGEIQATIVADKDQMSCISNEGHYHIANEAETELVCVVLTRTRMDTSTPAEFVAKFGWKNIPTRAKMTGN
jgi:WD40 repeat protein